MSDAILTTTPPGIGPRGGPPGPSPLGASAKTLWIAWGIEIACIGIGLMMALIVGFQAGGVTTGIMAGAPFAAAAIVELARIPLVRSLFTVRGVFCKALAVLMILLAGALTAENLIFGFERAFTVRIEEVRQKSQAVNAAKAEEDGRKAALVQGVAQRDVTQKSIDNLVKQERDTRADTNKNTDLAHGDYAQEYAAAQAKIDAVERDRQAMLARHPGELASAAQACRAAPDKCPMSAVQRRQQQEIATATKARIDAEQARKRLYDAEQQRLAQASQRQKTAEEDLHGRQAPLTETLREQNTKIDAIQAELGKATQTANRAVGDYEAVRRTSQMHRLAKFFFGVEDDAAAMRTLAWFSVVAAIVLSTAGAVLAAMHFRTLTQPTIAQPNRLARAVRGWIARQRRKHSVVRNVEVIREIEVPVERIVLRTTEVAKPELVLVPVPLEAIEEERRRIMQRAARDNGADRTRGANISAMQAA